ncbi:MAG: hypothetical protein WAU88_09610 [Candidatus Zixiibacteriota bacterium]
MNENNPYDFITNQGHPAPKQPFNMGGGKKNVLLIVVFALGVITVLIIGVSLLLSLGKVNNQDLITLRADQTELLRIIDLGNKDATDSAVKNRMASLQALVSSDATKLADLMKKRSVDASKVQLSSKKDSEIDSTLESAKQQGKYDTALLEEISKLSNTYYNDLKKSLAEATTKTEKEVLNTSIDNLKAAAASK